MARDRDPDRKVRGKPANETGAASKGPTRAVVIVPVLGRQPRGDEDTNRPRLSRSAEARLEEAVGLTRAIDLDPVHTAIVVVNDPKPATLLGSGKVEEFAAIVKEKGVWQVRQPRIERFIANMNPEAAEAITKLHKMLDEFGVIDRLREMGVNDGDTVAIGEFEFDFVD